MILTKKKSLLFWGHKENSGTDFDRIAFRFVVAFKLNFYERVNCLATKILNLKILDYLCLIISVLFLEAIVYDKNRFECAKSKNKFLAFKVDNNDK